MSRSTTAPLLVLYVSYLLVATFHPFVVTGTTSESVTRFLVEFLTIKGPATKDFAQNVVLFIPFGVLLYCSLKPLPRSGTARIFLTMAAGAALSVAIEIGQIFFARHPSLSDVIANSSGAVCGALLMSLCPVRMGAVLDRSWGRLVTSKILLSLVLVFGAAPLILSIAQMPWPKFRTWDSSFPFQLANEATLDRPWLGRIHLVAVYNRGLTAAEIANNFRSGFSTDATETRAKNGLVALYTFAERTGQIVHDVSGSGDPLNLSIEPPAHVNWLSESNGVEVARPAIIQSQAPANKLMDAFRNGDELSLEAWFVPSNLTQNGPARLVSFSKDGRRHNFTLGQEGPDVMFWLRNLISSRFGGTGLQTNDGVLTLDVSHVVGTYTQGIERLYVDGKEHPAKLDVTKDVIIGFGARKTLFAQIGYSFFYFFPVSLFVAAFLSSKHGASVKTFIAALAAGSGLLAMTDIFQAIAFDRAIDLRFIGNGLAILVAGSLIGLSVSGTVTR